MEFCQIAFQPPALKQTNVLWELFSPKIGKIFKTAVLTLGIDILTMTMVLDDILMDIMIDNGQIRCKLSSLVMVYIHWRTPTFHFEWVFSLSVWWMRKTFNSLITQKTHYGVVATSIWDGIFLGYAPTKSKPLLSRRCELTPWQGTIRLTGYR